MWGKHLHDHPLNSDNRTHFLLAQLYVLIYSFMTKKDAAKITIYDVAPWLRSKEEWKRINEKKHQLGVEKKYSEMYSLLGLYDIDLDLQEGDV